MVAIEWKKWAKCSDICIVRIYNGQNKTKIGVQGCIVKNVNASKSDRKRSIDLDLWITNFNLSIRSRWGFNALLAWARVGGILLIWLRFLVITADFNRLVLAFLLIGTLYSVSIALYSKRLLKRYDATTYHAILVCVDTIMVGCYIFMTDHFATDLFLFYFIPLATAAHFLRRKWLLLIGPAVVISYLGVLSLETYGVYVSDILIPWMGKSVFLLIGTVILRAQRGLPGPNESRVVAPSKARERLEKMLEELRPTLPYDTASIQLVYRDRLQIIACQGFDNAEEIYQIEFPTDDDRFPNKEVIQTQAVKIVEAKDFDSFNDEHYFADHIKSWMGIPLISPATGECFGMLSLDSSEPNLYTDLDKRQAGWFAKKVSSFLVETALGPAALTLANNRENLLGLLKSWADLLPGKTSKWDDDVQASQDLIQIGQKIFRTEDCSIFFLRHNYEDGSEKPVLHLIASTAVPQHFYQKREMKVTGQKGDGLTGLAVYRNRTLNYGAAKVERSPYRANFNYHLKFFFSKESRQVMIAPLRDSRGNAVGAIKIENRMGTSSKREFFPVEKNLFEIYASMVSLILETIRQRGYINRLEGGIHGVRGVVHHAAVTPLREMLMQLDNDPSGPAMTSTLQEIEHTLEYVKMSIHGVLADSIDNIYLEKEGLIHAVHHYLKSLRSIPFLQSACDCIKIHAQNAREDEMPFQIQEIFFNVAKEGILNIVRHSKIEKKPDGEAQIALTRVDGAFVLTVKDNGVGFVETEESARQRRSFGLNDIKRQMELKKFHSQVASVDIESSPGQGTVIQARWAP